MVMEPRKQVQLFLFNRLNYSELCLYSNSKDQTLHNGAITSLQKAQRLVRRRKTETSKSRQALVSHVILLFWRVVRILYFLVALFLTKGALGLFSLPFSGGGGGLRRYIIWMRPNIVVNGTLAANGGRDCKSRRTPTWATSTSITDLCVSQTTQHTARP